jgi:hypothetical protein
VDASDCLGGGKKQHATATGRMEKSGEGGVVWLLNWEFENTLKEN